MSDHTITLEFEVDGYWPRLTFKCNAAADARCRNLCSRDECEEGCVDPDNHPREPLGYCNEVEWLSNNDEPGSCIAGERTAVTLPVDMVWENDPYEGPSWKFAPSLVPADKPLFEVTP